MNPTLVLLAALTAPPPTVPPVCNRTYAHLSASAAVLAVAASAKPPLVADAASVCDCCAEWNADREPFHVFGNTYYVGVAGLSSVLITSNDGHVLIDGALPQSAPLIDAHICTLGFRTEDVKLILNSHAHFDHAGGIRALQRASGATVAASARGAEALERGGPVPDDPQAGLGAVMAFPPVKGVSVVKDGQTVTVGPLAVTAHLTPGHTPGSTTCTRRSCEGTRCLDVVYADSITPVAAPGFRYTGDASHPSIVEGFRRSIAAIAVFPVTSCSAPTPGSWGSTRSWRGGRRGRRMRSWTARPAARMPRRGEGARRAHRRGEMTGGLDHRTGRVNGGLVRGKRGRQRRLMGPALFQGRSDCFPRLLMICLPNAYPRKPP